MCIMVNKHMVKYRTAKYMDTKRLATLNGISNDSACWLAACLDPYHDFQMDLEGLPDERSALSVVQMHNQSVTISAPVSAGAGNWDCHITHTGITCKIGQECFIKDINAFQYSAAANDYDHGINPNTDGVPFGTFNIRACASGVVPVIGTLEADGGAYNFGSILGYDRCRVIGIAYEVTNTTAEIYKQGSCTVAMLSDVAEDGSILTLKDTNVAPLADSFFQASLCPTFPASVGDLLAMPGSQTWPAAKGIYAVPRMSKLASNVTSFGGSNSTASRAIIVQQVGGRYAATTNSVLSGGVPAVQPVVRGGAVSNFSPLVSIFSGLSPETTLTVTMRSIVEYFPDLGSSLLPLSSPSPAYDVRAFEIYNMISKRAQYAVEVKQNGTGEFFRKILALLSTGANMVAPFTGKFQPVVQGAAGLASLIANRIGQPAPNPRRAIPRNSAGPRSIPAKRR